MTTREPPDHEHAGSEAGVPEIEITQEGIRLGQFLKLAGLVDSGSDAKALLAEGFVDVDDVPETRRGRQLRAGEVVRIGALAARVGRAPGIAPTG